MRTVKLYSYDELGKNAKASAYKNMAYDHNFIIKQRLQDCAKVICKAFKGIEWDGKEFHGWQDDNLNMVRVLDTLDDMHTAELKNTIMYALLVDTKWTRTTCGYSVAEWLNSAYRKFFHENQATPECIAEYCKDCKVWFYANGARCYDF